MRKWRNGEMRIAQLAIRIKGNDKICMNVHQIIESLKTDMTDNAEQPIKNHK